MKYLNQEHWVKDAEMGINIAYDIMTESVFSDRTQDELMTLEEDSWWFTYRADVIIAHMDRYFVKNKITIDIGGGNGYTSSLAKKNGYLIGIIEPSMRACCHAKIRGIDEVNCGTVTEESIIDNSIEQALLLDVLEHIENDKHFLEILFRKMSVGGRLLITVPAFMCLWSSEDEVGGHFRRYKITELCNVLETCGFDVCYRSYFFGFLFLPILFMRVLSEKMGISKRQEQRTDEERAEIHKSQFRSRGVIINLALSFFECIEKQLMRREYRVPWGSSIVVVATKR